MKYQTPNALRQAIDTRLTTEATQRHIDIGRLRRRMIFERILVRLSLGSPEKWVLKGGVALEIRLRDRARATRDLDLALTRELSEEATVRELLLEALDVDPQGDMFQFRLARFREMAGVRSAGIVWRASVIAMLDSRVFDRITLDVVARPHETRLVEDMTLPGTLEFAGLPTVSAPTIGIHQHFAEKLHGMLTLHNERPSTRVKDLVDIILFIEYDLDRPKNFMHALLQSSQGEKRRFPSKYHHPLGGKLAMQS